MPPASGKYPDPDATLATAAVVNALQVLTVDVAVASTYALFAASVDAAGALVSDILLAPIARFPVNVPPVSGKYPDPAPAETVATAAVVNALHVVIAADVFVSTYDLFAASVPATGAAAICSGATTLIWFPLIAIFDPAVSAGADAYCV